LFSLNVPRPEPLGDVRTDAVSGPNYLTTHRVLRKLPPFDHKFPNRIRQPLGQLIDGQVLEALAFHETSPVRICL
jgi:hypothetical protein